MSLYTAEKAQRLLDLARNADDPTVRREADQVLVMDSHVLAETVIALEGKHDHLVYELRRKIATLDRDHEEWLGNEQAALEYGEEEEAGEAAGVAEGLRTAIETLRPLAWPTEGEDR